MEILENLKTNIINPIRPAKNRFVVYECTNKHLCGGWADRLKGIMSSYAWSLITNRKFLIRHTRPCLLTNMLIPNEIDWDIEKTNIIITETNKKEYTLIDNIKFRAQLLNFTNFYSSFSFIVFRNNNDWLENLSKNKIAKERLKRLGYDLNKFKIQYIFRIWYKKLFKLSPNLELKYKLFLKKAKLNNRSKLICAQVRIGGKREHVEYDAPFTLDSNAKIYWNYIKSVFMKNETNYKIFLTTDKKNIENEAMKWFGLNKVIINDGINSHLDREINLGIKNCNKVEKTFLDFHCLQNCDKAIISESGFGKLGVWNREKPNENLVMFSKMQKLVIKASADDLEIV